MLTIPQALKTYRRPDYNVVKKVYRKYWEAYTDAYVCDGNVKKELPFKQLIGTPLELNNCVKEDGVVDDKMK